MKMRPATKRQIDALTRAISHLKIARDFLKRADCPRTLARVRVSITSAGGALRHIQRRTRG